MGENSCKDLTCSNDKIFLEDFCWDHLSVYEKNEYGQKLLRYLKKNKRARDQNFNSVVIKGISFPEYIDFRWSTFVNTHLIEVNLQRADFRDAVFTRATVHDCHLEFTDFRGVNTLLDAADMRGTHFDGALLQNTNCTGADFRDAIFFDADMVGAMLKDTQLFSARFNNTRLRKESFCNFDDTKEKNISTKDERVEEDNLSGPLKATVVYSALKNNFKTIGSFEDERWAYRKERVFERIRLYEFARTGKKIYDKIAMERWRDVDKEKIFESRPRSLLKWLWINVERTLGYGVSAKPILIISAIVILICPLFYGYFGYSYNGTTYKCFTCSSCNEWQCFWDCIGNALYFSVVTFTTLGYGDVQPFEYSKIVASFEALTGLVFMALSVSILARNIFRN